MLSGKAGPCCCGTIFKSAEPESGGHFRLIGSKDRGTVGISILHCYVTAVSIANIHVIYYFITSWHAMCKV